MPEVLGTWGGYAGILWARGEAAETFVCSRGGMPELLWAQGGMPQILWA